MPGQTTTAYRHGMLYSIGQIGRNGLTFSGVIKLLNCIPATTTEIMLSVCFARSSIWGHDDYCDNAGTYYEEGDLNWVGLLSPEKMHFNSFPIRINSYKYLWWCS